MCACVCVCVDPVYVEVSGLESAQSSTCPISACTADAFDLQTGSRFPPVACFSTLSAGPQKLYALVEAPFTCERLDVKACSPEPAHLASDWSPSRDGSVP